MDFNGTLLSLAPPATIKSVGLWMIILGLAAEAAVIVAISSGTLEKSLSVIFTILIALGVWVEHIGSDLLSSPRQKLIASPKVRAEIVAKLKSFPGTKYDIGHPRENAREVWDFLWSFEQVLIDANWDHVDWKGGVVFQKQGDWPGAPQKYWYGEANVNNVSIEVRPAFRDPLMPAAKTLADALNAVGIVAITWDNNNTSMNDDVIHFLVGPKE